MSTKTVSLHETLIESNLIPQGTQVTQIVREFQIMSRNSIFRKKNKIVTWIFVPKISDFFVICETLIFIYAKKCQNVKIQQF